MADPSTTPAEDASTAPDRQITARQIRPAQGMQPERGDHYRKKDAMTKVNGKHALLWTVKNLGKDLTALATTPKHRLVR